MRHSLRKLTTRYEYLLRLILTVCTVLLLPAVAAGFLITGRAYAQLTAQNNEYYAERAYRFGVSYLNLQDSLRELCLRITLDDRLGSDVVEGNSYKRIEAVQVLADYSMAAPQTDFLGLYFFDTEFVITSKYTYSPKQFEWLVTGSDAASFPGLRTALEVTVRDGPVVLSSFDGTRPASQGRILVLVPVSTGRTRVYDAAMLYSLSTRLLADSMFVLTEEEAGGYAVFDGENRPFFYNENFDRTLIGDPDFIKFLGGSEGYYDARVNGGAVRIYRWRDADSGLCFVSAAPESAVMRSAHAFYQSAGLATALSTALLVCMGFLVIYINYRPVHRMVEGLAREEAGEYGELARIQRTIDRFRRENSVMSEVVSDQRLMLMESVLGNILYGIPVGPEKIAMLTPAAQSGRYCMLCVAELRLGNENREQLTRRVRTELNLTVYITDIPNDINMAVLCVLPESVTAGENSGETVNAREVAEALRGLMRTLYARDFLIGVGEVVGSPDHLRASWLSAREALEQAQQAASAEKKPVNRHLGRLTVNYVNENFALPGLSLMQVADRFDISVYTFSRLFREYTGIGFKEYVAAKRMEKARELLLSTNLNVYEIASAVGFENVSYFVTWFKTNNGMSPTRFRESQS